MTVRKRGDAWLIDVRQGRTGKRILTTHHGSESEAWELERAIRKKLSRDKPFPHRTVSTVVVDYLEHVRLHQSPVTYKSKKNMVYGHLVPFFGNLMIDAIPDSLIQRYKDKRLREIKSGTAKGGHRTVNLELLCLAAMAKWAGFPIKIEQLPYRASLPTILSKEEVKLLIDNMEPFYRAMFMCLYLAGMRKKEVCTLTWDRVSLEARTIVIKGKGGRIRMVPMHPALYDALMPLKGGGGINLVFPSRKSGEQIVDLRKAIDRAKKKAGITKRVYPHLMRHCFGTHVYNATGDLQAVSEALGHKELSTTRIYAKLSDEHMKEVIDKGLGEW